MKVKREQWEGLIARVAQLEARVQEAKSGTLMDSRTGPVRVNVVVPAILKHLGLESVHGYADLLPVDREALARAHP